MCDFVYRYLIDKLNSLNECIGKAMGDFRPEMRDMVRYCLKNGQRFRPLLFILGYETGGKDIKKEKGMLEVAASLEFLHKASLAHDDIVDGDDYRRCEESIPGKFGNKKGLILGDLLIAEAYRLMNSSLREIPFDKGIRCMELFNEIFFRLSEGEMMDILCEEKNEISEDECMKLMEDKTAVFIRNALVMGGILGGVEREKEQILREYGRNLGLAFQLINDLNNCNGLERELKRNFATDICQGKKNILLVKALEDRSSEIYGKVIDFFKGNRGQGETEKLVKVIMGNGVVGKIKARIDGLLSRCCEIAVNLPPCPSKQIMEYIPRNAYKKSFWKNKTGGYYER